MKKNILPYALGLNDLPGRLAIDFLFVMTYRTGDILRLQRANGSAAWFYQEIAENTAARSGSGPETQEEGVSSVRGDCVPVGVGSCPTRQ
jgi:hypothetical protein